MVAAPVFFLPGLLEDSDAFEPQIAALTAAGARCSVADLTRADTIAGMARDALAQAPAPRFALVGHSMGGYVAFEMLRQAPARIERLALIATNARPDTAEATEMRRRLMALAQKDFPAVVEAQLPRLMTPEALADATKSGTYTEMALGVGKETFLRQQEAIIARADSRPHLAAIRCPTLVVAGREDQIMPLEAMEEIARGIRGAHLEVIEQCGHMVPVEHPEKLAGLLVSWLE